MEIDLVTKKGCSSTVRLIEKGHVSGQGGVDSNGTKYPGDKSSALLQNVLHEVGGGAGDYRKTGERETSENKGKKGEVGVAWEGCLDRKGR